MKLLGVLRETPIGCALIAYFVDLPRWALLNVVFALAAVPSVVAALRGETALAFILSFPPVLVMTGLLRLFSATAEGRAPEWATLWESGRSYGVAISAWLACVVFGLLMMTPLLYLAVIPEVIVLLLAPLALCGAAKLNVTIVQAWRNALVMAVHFPVVALGLALLVLVAAWAVSISGGALVLALPALWAAIAVYTVDDLIQMLQAEGKP